MGVRPGVWRIGQSVRRTGQVARQTGQGIRRTGQALYLLVIVLCVPLLMGCAAVNYADTPRTIVLLAPFEGRYRDLGYDALYAARLALAEAGSNDVRLLPIDDGGTVSTAAERVQALAQDDEVVAVIALGYAASDPTVEYGSMPVLVVGQWGRPAGEAVYLLTSPEIDGRVTTPSPLDFSDIVMRDAPFVGSDVLTLPAFAEARSDLDAITVLSSSTLPDDDYIARILASDQFAAAPDLLSTLVYDATQIVLSSITDDVPIADLTYTGINGSIRFDGDGYWQNAPINRYEFDDAGNLITS